MSPEVLARKLKLSEGTRQDIPEIIDLLNATFRTPITKEIWEWYVYRNPAGNSRVYIARQDSNDALVGVIAFSPTRLRIGGGVVAGDYAHHLALRPDYRDTLSYMSFVPYSFRGQLEAGRKLCIGPPNKTAYPVHKALTRWVDFGHLDMLKKQRPSTRKHDCIELTAPPVDISKFYLSVSEDLVFCVEKDGAWMKWRLFDRPDRPYTIYGYFKNGQLRGYVAMKRWRDPDGYRKAHIINLHALDETALENLVAAAETYADGTAEVNLWAMDGDRYKAFLEKTGFVTANRQPLLLKTYDGSAVQFPQGPRSLSYGDGDTQY